MTSSVPRAGLKKVLVVDDQPDIREALRLLLKSAGYSAHMAESPDAAIAAAIASEPDMIVLDMNYAFDTTSGQEGLALLDRLGTLSRKIPIIAMTGWSTIELAVQAMQHGACDFITKPWDANQLLEVFAKHLSTADDENSGQAAESELAIARRVQRKLLPPTHFASSDVEFDCAFLPASEVGGDLYDYFALDSDRIVFMLGDVSGKGIAAALLGATLQATIRSYRDLAGEPLRLTEQVNRVFFQATRPEHFATLFIGLYDVRSQEIRYVNCGHPAPILMNGASKPTLLATTGTVLGAFEKAEFEEGKVAFGPEARLVLFSDGLSESRVSEAHGNEEWVWNKVQRLSRAEKGGLAVSLAAAAISPEPQLDDITVIDMRSRAA